MLDLNGHDPYWIKSLSGFRLLKNSKTNNCVPNAEQIRLAFGISQIKIWVNGILIIKAGLLTVSYRVGN